MESLSWDKIESKRKVGLFVIGIIAVIWLFYSFVLLPQWARIDRLTAQYNMEKKQLKGVETFAGSYLSSEQYMAALDNKVTQVNKMLPDNPDISTFLVDIGELAKECDIQIASIKPVQIVTKEEYREYDIEILLKGMYMQTMDFFKKSETGLRFTNVAAVGMKVSSDRLESRLLVRIYSYGVSANTDSKIID
jgi:Tfp pilus assembly protein PilO